MHVCVNMCKLSGANLLNMHTRVFCRGGGVCFWLRGAINCTLHLTLTLVFRRDHRILYSLRLSGGLRCCSVSVRVLWTI